MGFSTNPLSKSVSDSGHLDHRKSAASAVLPSSSSSAAKPPAAIDESGCVASLSTQLVVVFSLLTINPFSKLTSDDFSGDTPPWTTSFFGNSDSYSFPSSYNQARNRVHENVKRFARNYATIFFAIFTYELLEMPLALLEFVTCYAFWELFKFCSDKWVSNRYPMIRKILILVALCANVILLALLNVKIVILYALAISYTVMILHSGFKNLSQS